MSVPELLEGLDEEQEKAVTLETNGVIAAGAGSGKTRVLASRYVWLVTEKNLKPEEILTLTFTNKAVSEMYSRIYRYLLNYAESGLPGAARAKDAITGFHRARISTLDAFSANVARTAAARYGISPDFKNDEIVLRELARDAALSFVLDNRDAPGIRTLLVDHRIRELADEIFAGVVLKYSPVSSPLDFDGYLSAQRAEILRAWEEKTGEVDSNIGIIVEALPTFAGMKNPIKLVEALGEILLKNPPPPAPDIVPLLENSGAQNAIRRGIKKYFDYYSSLITARLPGRYSEIYRPLVDSFRLIKGKDGDGLHRELESIANYALNFDLCAGMFGRIKKFQDEFNAKKRKTGLLSFNDVAHLAIDALKDHPDIRKIYRDSIKMIMIDEFQDNNALQRDLVYLLAENPGRTENSVAGIEELEKDRLFFVGDEKQSIYRFRGADVAVFRSLENNLSHNGGEAGCIGLSHNYRSRPPLIAAFNHIFEKVFLPRGSADYEAVYSPIMPPEGGDGRDTGPLASFCFLNGDDLPGDDTEGIRAHDLEAAFIAGKIREMVNNREKIPKRTETGAQWVECAWGDFAVLERSYRHQSSLEKYFRRFEIPYNTDRPSGLFNDAPILDLRAYLRLLVYPEDRVAYAALIRSPFMRLGDISLVACMLRMNARNTDAADEEGEPFAGENEPFIPEADRALYRRARERYRHYRALSRTLTVTELITKLWYEEGYRYETLWAKSAQAYESLFDLFFSLAGECDRRGGSLAEFVDYLEDVISREEKPDDKDIPGEGETGVRIISIHKSKGLEFPVVFIYDSTNSGIGRNFSQLVSYHTQYGLILKIPQAEELPEEGNYFNDVFQEEEKAKDAAELRRLLYVAMTRAESRLFMTFTLPGQTQEEKREWDISAEKFNEETIRRRLIQLDENSEDKQETFLKLLQGILPDCPSRLCGLEAIPILSREVINKLAHNTSAAGSRRAVPLAAALAAAPFYDAAEILPEGKTTITDIPASALRYAQESDAVISETEEPGKTSRYSHLDKLFEQTGISPAEFGSLVHAVLEGRLKGQTVIPSKIKSRMDEKNIQSLVADAESMADSFLSSELGRRFAASGRRESEFPVITSVMREGKPAAIMGQIDLLFEAENEVVVVDFKTDRIENPADHYGQLAAYYRAAGDIFGKPASVWLFYLRG
ncbi:MAG: UvrD-helicase domain-containing protein, partial [Treponema sp.]|nr:UvrD-helicase domain-containing protein [Treponema sp.]